MPASRSFVFECLPCRANSESTARPNAPDLPAGSGSAATAGPAERMKTPAAAGPGENRMQRCKQRQRGGRHGSMPDVVDRIGLVIHEAGYEYRRRGRIEIEDIKGERRRSRYKQHERRFGLLAPGEDKAENQI